MVLQHKFTPIYHNFSYYSFFSIFQVVHGDMPSGNANANYQVCKDSSGSQSSGEWHGLQGEIQKNYEILQRRLSEEFQR